MDILHNLFGIDDNSLSSNDDCQQNSTDTLQHVQGTEQLEPLENIQQSLAGTPQSVQATEQLKPLANVQQNLAGTPRSVQATDQPAADYYEPRRKRSKVTVSITSLLYICVFIFAYS